MPDKENFSTIFVENLEKILKENEISQKKICEVAGLKKSAFNHWKKDNSIPAADTAIKIADFLGVSVEWLVTGRDRQGATPADIALLRKWHAVPEAARHAALLIIDDAYDALSLQKKA